MLSEALERLWYVLERSDALVNIWDAFKRLRDAPGRFGEALRRSGDRAYWQGAELL